MPSRAFNERLDYARFKALVATPSADNPFVLPGRGRLAVSKSASVGAGLVTVTCGRQSFKNPALLANQIHRGVTGERGMSVEVAGPAGDYTVYVVDPMGRHSTIAQITI